MKEPVQWVELEGHDYVLDLVCDLELLPDFPKQKTYFIISTEDPSKARPNASMYAEYLGIFRHVSIVVLSCHNI